VFSTVGSQYIYSHLQKQQSALSDVLDLKMRLRLNRFNLFSHYRDHCFIMTYTDLTPYGQYNRGVYGECRPANDGRTGLWIEVIGGQRADQSAAGDHQVNIITNSATIQTSLLLNAE